MEEEKNFHDDTVFNYINKYFIKLNDDAVKENNVHLSKVLDILIERMKSNDTLFNVMHQRFAYSGSYYKGTKIETPEEYDLNIVMKLPFNYNCIKIESHLPGYISMQIIDPKYKSNIDVSIPAKFQKLLVNNIYLSQHKWNAWVESTIDKALKTFPKDNKQQTIIETEDNKIYYLKVKKSGPAFTLCVKIPEKAEINIDLVSAIEFKQDIHTERLTLDCMNTSWYAIPKPLNNSDKSNINWRFSFYEQERRILKKNGRIKPVIKQMKKCISTKEHLKKSIASYYIETLCLHSVKSYPDNLPFTLLFMHMLCQLKEACKNFDLPHYWDEECNLFENMDHCELINIRNLLERIITRINKYIKEDPFIIAKYILNPSELERLRNLMTEQPIEPQIPQPTEKPFSCTIL